MRKKCLYLLSTLMLVLLIACNEDVLKSDYDHVPDPAALPKSLVTIEVSDTGAVDAVIAGSVLKKTQLLDWGVKYYTAEMLLNNEYKLVSGKDDETGDDFSVKIRGLVPLTDYYCVTYAMNANGVTFGNELHFKTTAPEGIPWGINASDPVSAWTAISFDFVDADDDGYNWELSYFDEAKTEIGLMSYSWYNAVLHPENYVFLPPLMLDGRNDSIEMDVQGFDPKFFTEKYKVIISTSALTNAGIAREAEVLLEETLPVVDRVRKKIAIPVKYKNKMVWIGFCHFESFDQFAIGITNIRVY